MIWISAIFVFIEFNDSLIRMMIINLLLLWGDYSCDWRSHTAWTNIQLCITFELDIFNEFLAKIRWFQEVFKLILPSKFDFENWRLHCVALSTRRRKWLIWRGSCHVTRVVIVVVCVSVSFKWDLIWMLLLQVRMMMMMISWIVDRRNHHMRFHAHVSWSGDCHAVIINVFWESSVVIVVRYVDSYAFMLLNSDWSVSRSV